MAAGRAAENSELVLQRDNVHIAGVEEGGGLPVRFQILPVNLEASHLRILIAPLDVSDGHREAAALGMPRCHSLQEVGGERRNAAFARQVIAEKRDGSSAGLSIQNWIMRHGRGSH